jgi:ABC-2 type transport system ATP-binding protein
MLEVTNLSKSFGKIQAVKDFSFSVKGGEILGLIGPNGAGKTTVLRCICSIIRPDKGKIKINGYDLFEKPIQAKQQLAFVPEIPYPINYLTVEEHVRFSARVFNIDNWENKADEMIRRFDLGEKSKELVNYLSKGQKQKVNIISSFIHDPQIILLDEPLYGIDPKGGKYLKDLIRAAKARNAAIVISSHMLGLVEELATKILIMAKGEKLAEGSIDEIAKIAHLKKDSRLEDVFIEITANK